MERRNFISMVALLQGIFYIATGIWPILHRRSFEAVTGPKVDFWLVRTTGALITVIGAVLALAGVRQKRLMEPEIPSLGIGAAASLGGADIVYGSRGRISKVYLLDALAEAGLIGLWLAGISLQRRGR